MTDPVEKFIEGHVEELGFELVELERAGSKARPIFRLRIDRPDSAPGQGVSLDDCRAVSRSLEAGLDARGDVPEAYVLEVSSPGVERPLVKSGDFERFRGREIAVHGKVALHGSVKRVEGELLGLSGEPGRESILLRTADGVELSVPREQVKRVHLVFRWGGEKSDA
ncbi:MAG: ribosome maturation factor RimP [Gemmatimonadota bacterium]|jgi:ribosome maturation factor RimP|nr:ribosome maturation factor RimP [Gemmatimonadota bacterium]